MKKAHFSAIKPRKFSFLDLQEMAERDDFCDILTAAGVSDIPVQESTEKKKWSEGEEFNASTFNYQQYEKDFLKK